MIKVEFTSKCMTRIIKTTQISDVDKQIETEGYEAN